MTFVIEDAAARAQLVDLSEAIDAAKGIVAATTEKLAEALGRADALRTALDQHAKAEPAPSPEIAEDLSAMLAANPSAAASADWSGKFRQAQDAHEAALVAWKGQRTIFEQAAARVDAEIEGLRGEVEAAEDGAHAAAVRFHRAAREAVMAALGERWATFQRDTLDVVLAFERFGGFRVDGQLNFSNAGVALTGANGTVLNWLYRVGSTSDHSARTAIDSFRASLIEKPARANRR